MAYSLLIRMNKVVSLTKISSKGHIKLPKEIMLLLDLKNGDKILWLQENDKIFIKKV